MVVVAAWQTGVMDSNGRCRAWDYTWGVERRALTALSVEGLLEGRLERGVASSVELELLCAFLLSRRRIFVFVFVCVCVWCACECVVGALACTGRRLAGYVMIGTQAGKTGGRQAGKRRAVR